MKAGLDEAGRGPVIGPMFLAVCVTARPEALLDLGVADSKTFGSGTAARRVRRRICHALFSRCEVRWIQVPAHVIDEHVTRGPGLNELERRSASYLLRQIRSPDRIVADGRTLFGPLAAHFPQLVAENRADQDFPEVAAASIVAKTFRDDWMENYEHLASTHGFSLRGGGYPNSATRDFIEAWERRFDRPPPHLRQSWKLQKRPDEVL